MSHKASVCSILSLSAGLFLYSGVATAAPTANQPSPYAQQIEQIHAIKVELEMADRDYKGHRGAAVKELHTAIRALAEGHLKHHKKHLAPIKGGGETQALSDAQLKDAAQKLVVLQTQLAGITTDPRATKAATAIQVAVTELQAALTVK